MANVPYIPAPFASPVVSPAVGSVGAPPIPYLSVSQYRFAPTAMDTTSLISGNPTQQTQALADTIVRASDWADEICFGVDAAPKGASLAASLTVEGDYVSVVGGSLRLVCDYKPVVEVVGVEVGVQPGATAALTSSQAAAINVRRRTIEVPWWGFLPVSGRSGDTAPFGVGWGIDYTKLYATWSYVNGYPHTQLAADVTAGATTCTVAATDGAGGLWGVYPASGAFLGTQLTVWDGQNTERVFVTAVTPGGATATLTTTPFANAHTVPSAPDFVAVSAIPANVQQAVISLTTCLIKTRGARGFVFPSVGSPERPSRQALAQAGALEDYTIARTILRAYSTVAKGHS